MTTLLNIRMLIITTGLFCLFVFSTTNVEGFASWCEMNQTVFVPEESTATFQTNSTYAHYITLLRRDKYQYIFRAYLFEDNIIDHVDYYDRSWENRTNISIQLYTDGRVGVRLDVSNISMKDNGTYQLYTRENACFILFVMQIHMEPTGSGTIEENTPVYVYAQPRASVVKRPFANVTMVWLLNGLSANETAGFVQQDGLIWIPRTQGGLDGKNVTYRAIQENGNVSDVNFTLNIMYGPSQPLTLEPRRTQYYLVSGDSMPDISCETKCKPRCSVSWGQHSSSKTLSLGVVTPNDTGEYTCTATRTNVKTVQRAIHIYVTDEKAWFMKLSPDKVVYIVSAGDMMPEIMCTADCNPPCDVSWGVHSSNGQLALGIVELGMDEEYICTATRKGSSRSIKKSVTVHVQDNTSFTIAIICLASVQAFTTLGIGLYAFVIYRRNKQSPCQTCCKTSSRQSSKRNTRVSSNLTVRETGLQQYEDLDLDSKCVTTVSGELDLPMTAIQTETGLQIYENTKLSSAPPM